MSICSNYNIQIFAYAMQSVFLFIPQFVYHNSIGVTTSPRQQSITDIIA